MRTTLILTTLLLTAGLAFAPSASADHGCDLPEPNPTCEAIAHEVGKALDAYECFMGTPPEDWVGTCP